VSGFWICCFFHHASVAKKIHLLLFDSDTHHSISKPCLWHKFGFPFKEDISCKKKRMPSTVIKSHSYREEDETLYITFISGKIYEYTGVNKAQYEEFKNASSKGVHFNKYIKPFHPFKELKHRHIPGS
jgi:hypothetical protein